MKFNLESIIKQITKPWTPIDVVAFDNKTVRIALFEGEYREHSHEYDEFFLVYKGLISVWTENGNIDLREGEGVTIPKGLIHKPIAKVPSYVLMIDST